MTYIERIVNIETNEVIEREYNAKEIAAIKEAENKIKLEAEIEAEKAADKAALLAKLGITQDEAKLLLS